MWAKRKTRITPCGCRHVEIFISVSFEKIKANFQCTSTAQCLNAGCQIVADCWWIHAEYEFYSGIAEIRYAKNRQVLMVQREIRCDLQFDRAHDRQHPRFPIVVLICLTDKRVCWETNSNPKPKRRNTSDSQVDLVRVLILVELLGQFKYFDRWIGAYIRKYALRRHIHQQQSICTRNYSTCRKNSLSSLKSQEIVLTNRTRFFIHPT